MADGTSHRPLLLSDFLDSIRIHVVDEDVRVEEPEGPRRGKSLLHPQEKLREEEQFILVPYHQYAARQDTFKAVTMD